LSVEKISTFAINNWYNMRILFNFFIVCLAASCGGSVAAQKAPVIEINLAGAISSSAKEFMLSAEHFCVLSCESASSVCGY
jgi:hypothetical protein